MTQQRKKRIKTIVLIMGIIFGLLSLFYGVHFFTSKITMKNYLTDSVIGDRNWHYKEKDGYLISAREFKFPHWYGEIHIEREGNGLIDVSKDLGQERLCLFVWKSQRKSDFGILITLIDEENEIRYYMTNADKYGHYIRGDKDNEIYAGFIENVYLEHAAEIDELFEIYWSIEGNK